jgi:DNA repair protein RadD
MTGMQLRPYQRAAIDCLWNHLRAYSDNPCIELPTGAGKSPTMAAVIHEALTSWPGTRIIVLAHVRELVQQNAEKLIRYWPAAPLGIYSASLGKRDRFAPVLFASIQSVYSRAMELGRFDLVLVDEAHRIPIKGEGMYRRFLDDARRANPDLRVVGFTATPYRLGAGPVCGPDYILNRICYRANVRELIDAGYLCRLVSKGGIARADLSEVHVRGGEYVASELEEAVNRADLVSAAVDEIVRYCADRRAWILFCASVKHATAVSAALEARGIEAPVVEGNTSSYERAEIIRRYQRGELRALCNVNVLSEGFDAPHVDAVILLRPTKSAGLYYQQVGRGLRIDPRKQDCLVLDFAGNILEHGPIDSIRVEAPRKRGDKATVVGAPTKQCPACQSIVLAALAQCPDCGHEWPRALARHDAQASDAPILSVDDDLSPWITEHQVTAVTYHKHEKAGGGIPSLRVDYLCGMRTFREWICLEHGGPVRARAVDWWRARMPADLAQYQQAIPRTVDGALMVVERLRRPVSIRVLERGKYPEILSHELELDPKQEGRDGGDAAARPGHRPGAAGEHALHGL